MRLIVRAVAIIAQSRGHKVNDYIEDYLASRGMGRPDAAGIVRLTPGGDGFPDPRRAPRVGAAPPRGAAGAAPRSGIPPVAGGGLRRLGGLLQWLRNWRAGSRRAALKALTNRQLTDAGIDPVLAGRGKAADVRLDPHLDFQS